MRLPIFAGLLLAAFALFNSACKKPTPFGAELLEDEYADYDFTDTITVECTLLREDSIPTSDKAASGAHFLCGEVTDPVFGKYRSDIYALMLAESLNPQFDSTTLDSIVLYLNYAPSGVYGDTTIRQTLRVLRLAETMNSDSTYYSNASLLEGAEIGRKDNFLPHPQKTDSLFEGVKGAFLAVRLNDDFGRELLEIDSLSWLSDSSFFEKLHGLKIVCAPNSAPGAMLAFDLNDNTMSRVALFYKVSSDTAQKRFDFFFRNINKFTHFEHDYTGASEIKSLIGKPTGDKLYLQGMDGLRVKVTFPYANSLDHIAVNKAQLVLTIADNNTTLPAADQLVFTESVGDNTYSLTSDVLYALGTAGTGSLKTFGGFPEKELINGNIPLNRYRMTLSEEFQHMIDDDAAPNIKNRTVYLNVYPRNRSARRTILYGPKSSTFPAKLELKYTRVK